MRTKWALRRDATVSRRCRLSSYTVMAEISRTTNAAAAPMKASPQLNPSLALTTLTVSTGTGSEPTIEFTDR